MDFDWPKMLISGFVGTLVVIWRLQHDEEAKQTRTKLTKREGFLMRTTRRCLGFSSSPPPVLQSPDSPEATRIGCISSAPEPKAKDA